MLRSLTILSLSLVASAAGQAQSTEEIHLRANMQAIVMLSHFSGTVTPVDFDPRYALTLKIESARPSVGRFREGAVVTLAIHSPSELFEVEPRKGKTYNFSLARTTEDGKVRFCCLQLE